MDVVDGFITGTHTKNILFSESKVTGTHREVKGEFSELQVVVYGQLIRSHTDAISLSKENKEIQIKLEYSKTICKTTWESSSPQQKYCIFMHIKQQVICRENRFSTLLLRKEVICAVS